ncbi:hypothetical protein BKA93DRAFT_772595 [Sparassis latifolia]|uniref:Chromatin target of PRMT1 protein C-terminal domain-containing protein n=1 Tax=Sparassis crispa TaxID=139825 RepID=A0A401GAK2_9APHY|nr:predicted protein [Sparassis crispa]GBE79185.1 predicted protein [Sparassis crispa]
MDTSPDATDTTAELLSYDDVPYSEQLPAQPTADPSHPQLADRIGNTKVYLLSETSGARVGKRKHGSEEEATNVEDDVSMGDGSPYRENAILFHGTPISHLPTSNIFAYATHFDAHPMALEWIDDTTCILVFPSKPSARLAHRRLAKSIAEEPSTQDGSVTAKPFPVALWPPRDRINKSLGQSEGLKGAIRMRWATTEDVKKRGAKNKSEFYKTYGREGHPGGARESEREEGQPSKRRKSDYKESVERAQLDDDLDAFLAEEDAPSPEPPSPPSKMRSDYIGSDGRTLLERTSMIRAHPDTLASRIMAPLPRRGRSRRGGREQEESDSRSRGERLGEGDRRSRGRRRSQKTEQDLDDELDAFLNEKD